MNREFSRGRRLGIAIVSLCVAALMFRREIAEALVVRGDEYLYRGSVLQALERYRRALSIFPGAQVAADRYVFVSMQSRSPHALEHAIAVATRYLDVNQNDALLLADRALCYLHARRYALAQADFERSARVTNSSENYVFAGWAAERQGRHAAAVALWRAALRMRPHYVPALIALKDRRT